MLDVKGDDGVCIVLYIGIDDIEFVRKSPTIGGIFGPFGREWGVANSESY